MRALLPLALWLGAGCGSAGVESPRSPEGAGDRALCVDPATATGAEIPLEQAGSPGVVPEGQSDRSVSQALEAGWRVHAVAEMGGGGHIAVIARAGCGADKPCEPQVVAVGGGKIAARTPLPATKSTAWGPVAPFVVDWLISQSGESVGEVWLSYSITGPPEPAVGATTISHVALLSLPDLSPRWNGVRAISPEAGANQRCTSQLSSIDADCDGLNDLILAMSCEFAMCEGASADDPPPECAGGPNVERLVYIQSPDRTFKIAADQDVTLIRRP